jgi:asparagine synthase (glutamine-hydrolysing)
MSDSGTFQGMELSELDAAFESALTRLRDGSQRVGVLFSGGVDSSLLAWELRSVPGVRLVTVGLAGSPDLASAEAGARLVKLPWSESVASRAEVLEIARRIDDLCPNLGWVDRSVQVAFAVALARSPPIPLVCGQGVDELFLGYAHYRGLAPSEAMQRSEDDLRKLVEREWPRTLRIAARLDRSVSAPYLDAGFVAAARRIPIEARLPYPVPKALFRHWAGQRGLPAPLVRRPKRALQYGSGVDRILRRRE